MMFYYMKQTIALAQNATKSINHLTTTAHALISDYKVQKALTNKLTTTIVS